MSESTEATPDIERLHPDDLIATAEGIAANIVKRYGSDAIDARVYRELAKRYKAAIEMERARWESARKAFGLLAPVDRDT